MASGRCAGCGRTESLRKIRLHIIECPQYINRFRSDPDGCLDPEAELHRYRTEDSTPEARAIRRDNRVQIRSQEHNRHQVASQLRWATPPDILD